ncbi:hypothetical protein AB0M96_30305, partial [Streptomyces sp. NPDC051098]
MAVRDAVTAPACWVPSSRPAQFPGQSSAPHTSSGGSSPSESASAGSGIQPQATTSRPGTGVQCWRSPRSGVRSSPQPKPHGHLAPRQDAMWEDTESGESELIPDGQHMA